MVEFRPLEGMFENLPPDFYGLNKSYDSGGTVFVSPKGVNKANALRTVMEYGYHLPLDNRVIFVGDSVPTDGPCFYLPKIVKIAVKDRGLIVPELSKETYFVQTPHQAAEIIENIRLEAKA